MINLNCCEITLSNFWCILMKALSNIMQKVSINKRTRLNPWESRRYRSVLSIADNSARNTTLSSIFPFDFWNKFPQFPQVKSRERRKQRHSTYLLPCDLFERLISGIKFSSQLIFFNRRCIVEIWTYLNRCCHHLITEVAHRSRQFWWVIKLIELWERVICITI